MSAWAPDTPGEIALVIAKKRGKRKKRKKSPRETKVKLAKKLARRIQPPPARVEEGKPPRKRPRSVDEILEEEGWE